MASAVPPGHPVDAHRLAAVLDAGRPGVLAVDWSGGRMLKWSPYTPAGGEVRCWHSGGRPTCQVGSNSRCRHELAEPVADLHQAARTWSRTTGPG